LHEVKKISKFFLQYQFLPVCQDCDAWNTVIHFPDDCRITLAKWKSFCTVKDPHGDATKQHARLSGDFAVSQAEAQQ